jgi:CHC2 zinc finger
MRSISSSTRPDSDSQASGETGNIGEAYAGQNYHQELIDRANTVPLARAFKHYGIRVDEYNRKTICPFKSHKGGRESTPSFYYYADTNSFRCFGCGVGHQHAHACEFVAAMESISRSKAAAKILDLFADDVDEDGIIIKCDFSERLQIMVDFSDAVRNFRQAHADEEATKFIEDMCWVYDRHNVKHDHTNEALRHIIEQLKEKINSYRCQT